MLRNQWGEFEWDTVIVFIFTVLVVSAICFTAIATGIWLLRGTP